jgi:hypothetical protein
MISLGLSLSLSLSPSTRLSLSARALPDTPCPSAQYPMPEALSNPNVVVPKPPDLPHGLP